MHSEKLLKRAILIGAVVAVFQTASFAAPSHITIYFTPGGSSPALPQLDNTGGGATDSGSFNRASGNILEVLGGNSVYMPGYITDIGAGGNGDADNYVAISGFGPSTDNIYVALKLDSGGSYIDPSTLGGQADIEAIDLAINSDASNPNYLGPLASPVSGAFLNVFAGYDILLSFPDTFNPGGTRIAAGSPEQFDVGFDFRDYTGTGSPVTVTSFAVVPEPTCLGILGAAGLVLLPRYRRRRA